MFIIISDNTNKELFTTIIMSNALLWRQCGYAAGSRLQAMGALKIFINVSHAGSFSGGGQGLRMCVIVMVTF
jgi:hypothetical protein